MTQIPFFLILEVFARGLLFCDENGSGHSRSDCEGDLGCRSWQESLRRPCWQPLCQEMVRYASSDRFHISIVQ